MSDDEDAGSLSTRAFLADVTAARATGEGVEGDADPRTYTTLARCLYVAGGGPDAVAERLDERRAVVRGTERAAGDDASLADRAERSRRFAAAAGRASGGEESVTAAVRGTSSSRSGSVKCVGRACSATGTATTGTTARVSGRSRSSSGATTTPTWRCSTGGAPSCSASRAPGNRRR